MDHLQTLSIAYECESSLGNSLELKHMSKEFLRVFLKKTSALFGLLINDTNTSHLPQLGGVGKAEFFDSIVHNQPEVIDKYSIIMIQRNQRAYRYLYIPLDSYCLSFVYSDNNKLDIMTIANIFHSLRNKINIGVKACLEHQRIQELNNTLELKVQEEIEKSRLQEMMLLRQSRLAQMGEMISMIAHQWRQPLTAISTTSGLIEYKASLNRLDSDDIQKKAKNISSYAQHLSHTIDDFRNFFKPNKEKKVSSYDEIIKSVLGIIEVSITNKNIQLIQNLHCHEMFNTYPNELKQVLLNLIRNAEDVLVEKEVKDPMIEITTFSKKDRYILEVRDNGGGIIKEIMDKIFDPYFSTKVGKGGTGLGLYMSKMIVEEHCGGLLQVKNDKEGATFSIISLNTN